MKVELNWNELDGNWWYGIGLSFNKTTYHPKYKYVFTIELLLSSIYIRW